jgi:general secretion pathway protein F
VAHFQYIAIAQTGRRTRGRIHSADRRQAIRELIGRGCFPTQLEPVNGARAGGAVRRLLRRCGPRDLAIFTRQLASLLKAGLTVTASLGMLRHQCRNRHLSAAAVDMGESLARDGGSLAEVMEVHTDLFDPVYRGLVRSGQESGDLVPVLNNLADHLSRQSRVRGQVISAFIYPLFLLGLGLLVIFVLVAFVLPRFQELFASFGQALPLPTRVLIAAAGFLSTWWPAIIAAGAGAVLLGAALMRRPKARLWCDRALLRAPLLGDMFLKLEISRIARTLSALLRSGVRIVEALRITSQTAGNLALRGGFAGIIQSVLAGQPLAEAIHRARMYPRLVVQLIQTGEQTSQLPQMLGELSEIYEEEAERAVTGAAKVLEPALIVVMGTLIAGIVAAVMLPVFQANAMSL